MTRPTQPTSIALFYEDRDEWKATSSIPLSSEAARWLAPPIEIAEARRLIESCSISVIPVPINQNLRASIYELLADKSDIMIWNLSDGLTVFNGSLVPSLARLLRIPSFGSSTYVQGLCQHKHHWKAVLTAHGINCAPSVVVREGVQSELDAIRLLSSPHFVKTATYGNNAGYSVVDPISATAEEAFEKAKALISGGLGPVLVETYLPGREYSVWCLEHGIWSSAIYEKVTDAPYLMTEIKDRKQSAYNYNLERRFCSNIDAIIANIINIIGIKDYVRVDIREDKFGNPLPIDINTGAFLIGRSFNMACRDLHDSPDGMFRSIVQSSWQRQTAQFSIECNIRISSCDIIENGKS